MAIPPLGTGNLKAPVDELSDVLLDELFRFSASNPNTSLKTITVIVYPKDVQKVKVNLPLSIRIIR